MKNSLQFRKLKAEEIDVRISQTKDSGASLLLYKDARCDMNILDETVGAMNWQRMHSRDNANCTVSIWDDDKKCWICKEDTGIESNSQAEKGLASDSFKRACVNWGIGRELYTAPFIWVRAQDINYTTDNKGKPKTNDQFSVSSIEYDANGKITSLTIKNETTSAEVYHFPGYKSNSKAAPKTATKTTSSTRKKEEPSKQYVPPTYEQALEMKMPNGIYQGAKLRDLWHKDVAYIKQLPTDPNVSMAILDAVNIIQAEITKIKNAKKEQNNENV